MPSTKKSVCLFASGLLVLLSSIYSFGQTSSFTYQGKLNDGGGLANAQYDFVFRLFDPSGTQVGSDLARDDIQVTAGIFTVTLDFGSSPFLGGAADTLEIGVRPGASAGSYTILAPRQPLTSSPYAIKSSSASTADTSTNAFQLGGIVANQYVVTNDARMTDARLPTPGSGDYVQNTTSPQSTSNFNISGTGNANIFNANTQYNLGLARVLSNAGTNNLFVGQVAGNGNTTGITNTFVGSQAGQLNISGSRNSFFGARAGLFNSTDGNSFFGAEAGGNTTTGGANSFFGNSAGSQNQTGFANSFFGAQAGELTTGIRNVSVGTLAGVNNTSGGQNTFIGAAAGESNVTGGSNSTLGYLTDVSSNNLNFATAIGALATVSTSNTIALGRSNGTDTVQIPGALNVTGPITGTVSNSTSAVTATNALQLGGVAANQYVQTADARLSDARNPLPGSSNYIQNTTSQEPANFNVSGNGTVGGTLNSNVVNANTQYNLGSLRAFYVSGLTNNNTVVGVLAGSQNPSGGFNSFFGCGAGQSTTTGSGNSFFGCGAGGNNTSGGENSFFGRNSGIVNTANENSFFGSFAGAANTNGFENSFFGKDSGRNNSSGNADSFFGWQAGLSNTTGASNSFFGEGAGSANTTACCNSFVGSFSGGSNTTGAENSFFGASAGGGNRNGSSNSFFGTNAGASNFQGNENAALGNHAGFNNENGNQDTFLGASTGLSIKTVCSNEQGDTFVGYSADGAECVTNGTAIGALAKVTQSNSLVLGSINGVNGATADTNVGIGTTAPQDKLEVNGIIRVDALGAAGATTLCRNASNQISTCSSSIRYKNNINNFSSGLDLIRRLRPVSFNWKAGGMPDMGLVAEEVAAAEPLLITHNDKGQIEGVKYDRVGVVLINAIKEQQAQIERQQKLIEDQQKQIDALRKLVAARLRPRRTASKNRIK